MLNLNQDQNRQPGPRFNFFEEYARGIIYRGGKELDDYMSGYIFGLILAFGLLAVLFILGSLGFSFV